MTRTVSLLLAMVLISASSASGQQVEPGNYDRLVREALAEVEAGNWAEASSLFQQAHAVQPNARTLRGLGISAFELRRYVDAIGHLQAALAHAINPLTEEQRKEANDVIARAQRLVGVLDITTVPADATLAIDGRPTQGRSVQLDVGEHELRATAQGHADAELKVAVVGGQRTPVTLTLVSSSAPTPASSQGAEWDALISTGMQQEGVRTQAERAPNSELLRLRSRVRPYLRVGAGFTVTEYPSIEDGGSFGSTTVAPELEYMPTGGAGPFFEIGGGARIGLSTLIQINVHAFIMYAAFTEEADIRLPAASSDIVEASLTEWMVAVEPTLRLMPVGAWYVGLGPSVGAAFVSTTCETYPDVCESGSDGPPSDAIPLVRAALETGFLLLPDEQLDVGIRGTVGMYIDEDDASVSLEAFASWALL